MPALIRSVTLMKLISRPSNRILPLSGCRCALIRLTSEVLPAPLDPTRDKNSPWWTTKLTPSQARVSPNCFLSSTVSSRITSGLLLRPNPGRDFRQRADDAGRQRHDQQHQNGAEQELPILGGRHRIGLQIGEHDAADDRAGEVAESTEQGGKHDLARERPVQHLRRRETIERNPENAREPGKCSRDQKGDPAETADSQAQECGTDFVVADGLQRLAERGMN